MLILKFWCNNSQNTLSNSHHNLLTEFHRRQLFWIVKKPKATKTKMKKKNQTATKQSYFGVYQNQYWESLHEKQNASVFRCSPLSRDTVILFFLIHILVLEIWQHVYFLFEVAVSVFSNQNISHIPSGVCLLEGPKLKNVAF